MPEKSEERKLDETLPGGLYVVGDRVVNANGDVIPGWSVIKGEAVKVSSQKSGADQLANPGQKLPDESSSADLPRNIEKIHKPGKTSEGAK